MKEYLVSCEGISVAPADMALVLQKIAAELFGDAYPVAAFHEVFPASPKIFIRFLFQTVPPAVCPRPSVARVSDLPCVEVPLHDPRKIVAAVDG